MNSGEAIRRATIELAKEDMHFSAAHFTIFSAEERENLHGHNFFLEARATGPIGPNGLCFDYSALKSRLRALCDSLDERLLLPAESPHLDIDDTPVGVDVRFADETMSFRHRDVKLLPLRNVTVEELARYFTAALADDDGFARLPIDALTVRVASGPGQWAEARWPPDAGIVPGGDER